MAEPLVLIDRLAYRTAPVTVYTSQVAGICPDRPFLSPKCIVVPLNMLGVSVAACRLLATRSLWTFLPDDPDTYATFARMLSTGDDRDIRV